MWLWGWPEEIPGEPECPLLLHCMEVVTGSSPPPVVPSVDVGAMMLLVDIEPLSLEPEGEVRDGFHLFESVLEPWCLKPPTHHQRICLRWERLGLRVCNGGNVEFGWRMDWLF